MKTSNLDLQQLIEFLIVDPDHEFICRVVDSEFVPLLQGGWFRIYPTKQINSNCAWVKVFKYENIKISTSVSLACLSGFF